MHHLATYRSRGITQAEQQLYDHWLNLVQTESPSQLIDRFHCLFIEGMGYPNAEVQTDLDRLVNSTTAEQEFPFILNRCCHILINRWQARSQFHPAIVELIGLFEIPPTRSAAAQLARSQTVKQLRQLVQNFLQSKQYFTLRRLAQVMNPPTPMDHLDQQPLVTLIRRYPYLYEHCLIGEGTPAEHQASIRQLQAARQQQFEIDLSHYVAYQIRRTRLAQTPHINASVTPHPIQPIQNPTLLDDRSFNFALQQFVGKVEGAQTCRDMAKQFLSHCHHTHSYQDFKDDLYEYITASVDSGYGKHQFNAQLSKYLKNTSPESNTQPLTDFLLVRTCSQLLNFLVVESSHRPHHFVFINLLSNLGATLTIRLLLKIVLLCSRVKPFLEKRFSILFHHYEAQSRDRVQWLIAAMENLQLALSTNFSTVNLCFVT